MWLKKSDDDISLERDLFIPSLLKKYRTLDKCEVAVEKAYKRHAARYKSD